MSFWWSRSPHTKDKRTWTPRRIQRAELAVQREAQAMALFPELRRFHSVDERVALVDDREFRIIKRLRDGRAKAWRDARRTLRRLAPEDRDAVLRKWNTRCMPGDPTHLSACILSVLDERNPSMAADLRREHFARICQEPQP
jgi:hypothetical protein